MVKFQVFFKAFSYNEILIVVLLMSVVLMIISPFVISSINRNGYNETENRLIELIRTARRRSIEEYKNISWTLCYSEQSIFISDSACSAQNTFSKYDIPNGTVVSNFNKITFFQNTGEVENDVDISITAFGETKHISINQGGGYVEN